MMRSTLKLFLVLVTLTVAVLGWITGQYRDRDYLILIIVMISVTIISFLLMNIHERRLEDRKRILRESQSRKGSDAIQGKVKRSKGTFALREKKAGLTWGGGNIKASAAKRGTKRKFLGT